jgi:hypothetical protein
MDETTFLVSLLADNWNAAITALGSDIPAVHRVRPQIMDIRSMDSTRNTTNPGRGGNRARISRAKDQDTNSDGVIDTADLIVCMEESQTIEYPTFDYSVRNESYTMGIRIRTKQDDRRKSDGTRLAPSGDTFGRDRIENLYKIVRYILENNRRGWIQSGSVTENFKHIEMGSRVEQNDKKSRIFGYKVSVMLKRFSVSL